MFFYYCFTNKFGYDQVCRDSQEIGKVWDLFEANGSHFIALGSELSWQEQYGIQNYEFSIANAQIIWSIFSKQTLELIHRMVYWYYTSYRAVISLFISDLWQYLKAIQKLKTLTAKDAKKHAVVNDIVDKKWLPLNRDSKIELAKNWSIKQSLVIFPDLLSLKYRLIDSEHILSGQDTNHKVMKYYYDLQQANKNILVTTWANMYMDRKQLDQIILYFPKTRYYKAQQDPRLFIPELVEKMTKIRKAKLTIIDLE